MGEENSSKSKIFVKSGVVILKSSELIKFYIPKVTYHKILLIQDQKLFGNTLKPPGELVQKLQGLSSPQNKIIIKNVKIFLGQKTNVCTCNRSP